MFVIPATVTKIKYFDKDWMYSTDIHSQDLTLRGEQADSSGDGLTAGHPVVYDEGILTTNVRCERVW